MTSYWRSIVDVALSRVVSEIFNVKKYRDLEITVRGQSRSSKVVPFDRLDMVSYQRSIESLSLRCVCETFDFKCAMTLKTGLGFRQGQSPILVITGLDVEQLRWSRPTRYRYTKPSTQEVSHTPSQGDESQRPQNRGQSYYRTLIGNHIQ